jgi:hypothetical protein
MQPNDKLNIDSLTLDNVIGDGVEVLQDDTEVQAKYPQEVEEVTDEISAEPDYRGDEDDYDDEYQHEQEDQNYIEDDADEDVEAESGSIAFEVAKTLGFELDGDYEDSVEGLTNFVKDVTQNAAEEQLEGLFQQFPEVQQHLDYVLAGGESREFFQRQGQQIDYNSIQVEEGDVNMQRAILAQFLQTKGHDTEFIQDTIDTYEDSGKLYNNAEKAKRHLAAYQKEEQEQMMAQQREQYDRQQEQQQEFWSEVADTIESGNEFAGVRIPDREKSNFFEYISASVGDNGETQRDLDYQEAATDVKLAIDYMLYSGFDLNGVIEKKAKTQAAKNLRNRIVSNEERVKSARKQQSRSTNVNFDDLDLGSILQ